MNRKIEMQLNLFACKKNKVKYCDNKDHRARIYDKILKNGEQSLTDKEILEVILFAANTRKNTKVIAGKLLKEFGSLTKVINADQYELKQLSDIGNASIAVLKTLLQATKVVAKENIIKKNPLTSPKDVINFCRTIIGNNLKECTLLIFLNGKNQIIDYKIQHEGTFDKTPIYLREVSQESMKRNASGLILAHNHPNNNCNPSSADISTTIQLKSFLKELSINLQDHIIVCPSGYFSFKNAKLLI